jgi:hypothetical protein
MAIDFPASPTLNDVFTVGNVTYVWDGTKWTASVTGGISLDKIEEGNTSAEVIDTGSDGRFVVTTEGTERLFVDASGNVGVGTNVPQQGLHVHNSGSTASRIRITNSTTTDAAGKGLQFTQSGVNSFITNNETGFLTFNTSGAEHLRITSAGLVGIGTNQPVGQLNRRPNASNFGVLQMPH